MQENRLEPKLRFPEFSGEWDKKKLGSISKKNNIKNKDESVTNVFTNSATQGIVNQQDYFDRDIANQNNLGGYYVVQKNDFIYNPRISKAAPVGPIKRNHLGEGVMSPLYSVFRFEKANLSFLEFYFKSTFWHQYMKGIANYGARHDRMNITNEDFFKMPVPFPTFPEQEKIASFLTSVDSKIEKLEKKRELMAEYKRGVMQKIFSQEIKFSDEDGKEYPEWVSGTIDDFGSFYYGKSAPKHSVTDEALTPCVRYGELYSTYNEIIKDIKSYTNIPKESLKFSKGGEVLVPRVGEKPLDFANCSYLPIKGVAIGEMISVYNTKENGLYITYYFNFSLKKEFAKVVEGVSVSNLYFRYLEKIKINLPCLEEQKKIANFLLGIDKKIELIEQETEQVKEFKRGLLQQMFV